MALDIQVGDLFNAVMDKDNVVVIHGCNAQGVMGSGFAGILRKLYPYAFMAYHQVHRRSGLKLGDVVVANPPAGKGPIIHNAITQEFYGRDGKQYADYDAIIVALQASAKAAGDKPIHLPMIGGGLGGLDPKRLTAIFQAVFVDSDATLWLKED